MSSLNPQTRPGLYQADAPHPSAPVQGAWTFDVVKVLMICMIIYLPNQALFGSSLGVKGLNAINILFLSIFFMRRGRVRPPLAPTPLKKAFVFFSLILVWAFLVGVVRNSPHWAADLTVLKNSIFYMLLYFLFFHAVDDVRTIRVLVLTIAFVTLTSVVLGFRQALDYGLGSYNETRRVAAPFGWGLADANRSAIYFCIYLPLLATIAMFYKSRPALRIACLAIFLLGVFVDFHTYSRQSYFILAVSVILLALRKSLFVAAIVCLALLNYDAWVPETVLQRIEMTTATEGAETVASIGEEAKYDESTASRLILWDAAAVMISDHPWGIGLNQFKREIGNYVDQRFAGKDAHNFYVLITAEAGVIAPIAVMILIVGLLSVGWRALRIGEDEDSKTLGIAQLVCTVSVVLGSMYGSRFLDGDVMGLYWIFSGLVARYWCLQREPVAQAQSDAARRPVVQPVKRQAPW
jgi:O-antigen ligase